MNSLIEVLERFEEDIFGDHIFLGVDHDFYFSAMSYNKDQKLLNK